MSNYLHDHKQFLQLLKIISGETGILEHLIEKDYWLMHVLFGLKEQGFEFDLKGGTSLSKGHKIIDRFSEDIDILIKPLPDQSVETNPRKNKPRHIQSRKDFYDQLAQKIKIEGIISVERDTSFDNKQNYNSGGIRLIYNSVTSKIDGLKEGILLEAGFDTVTPNSPLTISSWAYDKAILTTGIEIKDNRAPKISCYHPGYSFVEKLQTIATKFRKEQETGEERPNLMRQYYDVFCLLGNEIVNNFIGTAEYHSHKKTRFPPKDFEIPIKQNEAFLLSDKELRERFRKRYLVTASLYYKGQPDFDDILVRIFKNLERL